MNNIGFLGRKKAFNFSFICILIPTLLFIVELAIERHQLNCIESLRTANASKEQYEAVFGPLTWNTCDEGLCSSIEPTPNVEFRLRSMAGNEQEVEIGALIIDPSLSPGSITKALLDRYCMLFWRIRNQQPIRRCASTEIAKQANIE